MESHGKLRATKYKVGVNKRQREVFYSEATEDLECWYR